MKVENCQFVAKMHQVAPNCVSYPEEETLPPQTPSPRLAGFVQFQMIFKNTLLEMRQLRYIATYSRRLWAPKISAIENRSTQQHNMANSR